MNLHASLRRAADDWRALSWPELAYRGWSRLSHATGRHRRLFPPGRLAAGAVSRALGDHDYAASPDAWLAHLRSRRTPAFFFGPDDRSTYRALLESLPGDTCRADAICGGSAILFGHERPVRQPIDWHADPLSGHRWRSDLSWWQVPVTARGGGDVRVVWELNRHRDLCVLGRAYWRTGDERYADVAARRLRSWLDQNIPELGVNWHSNLEIAVRSLAWIWALQFFLDAPAFDAQLVWDLTADLFASARHLSRDVNYSRYCMPGNHVIGDAAGLAAIALMLPEMSEADAWRRQAMTVLDGEVAQQTTPDGDHVEQSPAYHVFVWELLYTVASLATRNGVSADALWSALQRMSDVALLVRPDRLLPASGDSDDAVAYDVGHPGLRLATLAAVAATRFERRDLAEIAGRPPEGLLWLEGPAAVRAMSCDARRPAAANAVRPAFGVAARTNWAPDADYCFMRGGSQSRHTHADALHLDIVVDGAPVVIDSGTGGYTGSAEWRAYFRSTSAHNTVRVDGCDQARQHRAFRWASSLKTIWRTARHDEDATFLDAEHGGYERLGVRHRRQVLWVHDWGWVVLDRLSGSGSHDLEVRWHFAGDTEVQEQGARVITAGRPCIALACAPLPDKIDRHCGESTPIDGWSSPAYGARQPSPVVVARYERAPLPFVAGSFLCPLRGSDVQATLEMVEQDGALSVKTTRAAESREFRFDASE